MQDRLSLLINEFGLRIGLPDLALSPEDTIDLVVDGRHEVMLVPQGDVIELACSTGIRTGSLSREQLVDLLEGNHLGALCGKARLGIDGDVLVLSEPVAMAGLDAGQLIERLDAFMGYVDFWSAVETHRIFAADAATTPMGSISADMVLMRS